MEINGIHIEPTNICTLKCPACARTRFIEQWPQKWQNHSINIDSLLRFLDINLENKRVLLCGNYGDPIYHPDFIELVRQLKSRGSYVIIVTNGSYQKKSWWQQLVSLLGTEDNITFSIDGTSDNFIEYRRNADWSSIAQGMQVVSEATCNSTWKYIPFSFNQYQIEEAKKQSITMGIKKFVVDPSARFDDKIQWLKPDNDLVGHEFAPQQQWKLGNRNSAVDPKCFDGERHFISAEGYYAPCCFSVDHNFYYKNQFGKNKSQYDINQCTLTEILKRQDVANFNQTLEQQTVCQYNCPRKHT